MKDKLVGWLDTALYSFKWKRITAPLTRWIDYCCQFFRGNRSFAVAVDYIPPDEDMLPTPHHTHTHTHTPTHTYKKCLKALTAILAPLVTLPSFTHASQNSTSPFHSPKTAKVYICCKHAKTAPKTHCWLRPKPCRQNPFLCRSEILRDENNKQIKHTFGRPTGLSVRCSPLAMPPWISHFVLPSAAFH